MPDSLHKRLERIKQYGWGVHEERPNESGPWVRLTDVLTALDQPELGEDCGTCKGEKWLCDECGKPPSSCEHGGRLSQSGCPDCGGPYPHPDPPQVSDGAVEAAAEALDVWQKAARAWTPREAAKVTLQAALPALEAHWQTKPEIRRLLANNRKQVLAAMSGKELPLEGGKRQKIEAALDQPEPGEDCERCGGTGYEGFHDAGRLCWRGCPDCEAERCSECGGPIGLVWWCYDDSLWQRITGNAKPPGRENAAGNWCTRCFDAQAQKLGVWIEWAPLNLRHLEFSTTRDSEEGSDA